MPIGSRDPKALSLLWDTLYQMLMLWNGSDINFIEDER
jgi:hypothetical protein